VLPEALLHAWRDLSLSSVQRTTSDDHSFIMSARPEPPAVRVS